MAVISKDRSYHALHENASQLTNSCHQQQVEKGVALCDRQNQNQIKMINRIKMINNALLIGN